MIIIFLRSCIGAHCSCSYQIFASTHTRCPNIWFCIINCNVLQHICKCRKKKCVRSSGDLSAAELLCFAWDQRDCQVPGKQRVEGPGREWMDFIHKTVKTRNQSTSLEYAKYPMKPVHIIWEKRLGAEEVHRLPLNAVSRDWNGGGHVCGWMRRTRHLEGSMKTDGVEERWNFYSPGLNVPRSTVQTSAVRISAHLVFQR